MEENSKTQLLGRRAIAKKRWIKYSLFAALLLAVGGASAYFVRANAQKAKLEKLAKRSTKVIRTNILKELNLSGKVLPLSSVAVFSPVSGQLKEIFIKEGDAVKTNDVLFSVIQDTSGQRELEAAETDVAKAQLEYRVAEEQIERRKTVKDLFSDLENKRAEDEASRRLLELQAAKQRLALLRERLGISSDRAPSKGRKNSSADEVIFTKSPKDGIVTFINKSVGESVLASSENADSNGRDILTISDLKQMMVRSRILESDLSTVRVGMPVQIRLDAFRDKIYSGKVSRISMQGVEDRSAGYTYFVTDVVFDEPDQNVRSQMNANLSLAVAERKDALALPANAVATIGEHSVTELPPGPDGKPRYRKITVGLITESFVEITDPTIAEGDEFLEIDFSKIDLSALGQGQLGKNDQIN